MVTINIITIYIILLNSSNKFHIYYNKYNFKITIIYNILLIFSI